MMKNKKILIISLIILSFVIIALIIIKPFYNSKVFDEIGKDEIINYLKNIEDYEQKQKEIEEAIKKGWISQKDINNI